MRAGGGGGMQQCRQLAAMRLGSTRTATQPRQPASPTQASRTRSLLLVHAHDVCGVHRLRRDARAQALVLALHRLQLRLLRRHVGLPLRQLALQAGLVRLQEGVVWGGR